MRKRSCDGSEKENGGFLIRHKKENIEVLGGYADGKNTG